VDLFPAAIAEKHVKGGLVGPTFACLLGRQFSDIRRGDRYWYENSGPFRFSQGIARAVHIQPFAVNESDAAITVCNMNNTYL